MEIGNTALKFPAATLEEQIENALRLAGFGDRLGRRFLSTKHAAGLPRAKGVEVRPDYSPVDGDHVVFVTGDQVQSFFCLSPCENHQWVQCGAIIYGTPREMVQAVRTLANQPKGCWR